MLKPVDPTAPSSGGYGFGSVDRKRARSRDPPTCTTHARKKVASEISFEFQSLSLSAHGVNRGAVVSSERPSRAHPQSPGHDTKSATSSVAGGQQEALCHSDTHNIPRHDASNCSSSSSSSSLASSPLPCSSHSPLSPHLSRPPSSLAIASHGLDDMDMSRQDSQETLLAPMPEEQLLKSRYDHGSMAARVLNMRQRKWNSARKEWQEWHEVQATHAPNLSNSIAPQHELQACQGATEQMELFTDPIPGSARHVKEQLHTYPSSSMDAFSDPHGGDSSLEESVRGKQSTRGQSNGLGRQRSLHDSRERYKDTGRQHQLESEERYPVGTRTRSYSETHIYPYTQHHHLQLQQVQSNVRNPNPFCMPIPQRAGLAFSQTESQQQPGSHREYDTYTHHYHHHADGNEMGGDMPPSSGPSLHRVRHSQSVSEHSHLSHLWTSLTMTPLEGPGPGPGPGLGPSSSRKVTSASSSPALSPTYGHRDEPNSWTQQLLQSQGVGNQPAHHHYLQSPTHPYLGQHHGDDVAMGEETVARGLPSRSSSPSPCLSMVPTVNRPLSISFSQLVGSHMLEDLAEHDDDMEL